MYFIRLIFISSIIFATILDIGPTFTNLYCCEKNYDRQDIKRYIMLPSIHDYVKLTGFSARDIKLTELPHGNRKATLILGSYVKSATDDEADRRNLIWHRITAWGGLAGDLALYIKRGTRLSVSARVHQKSSISQDGTVKNWEELVLIDFRKLSSNGAPEGNNEYRAHSKPDHSTPLHESSSLPIMISL